MKTDEEKSYYSGFTEGKPDLNQDLFDYLFKTFNITPLFDEISGLVSIFEKHGWSKKVWEKEKPDYPCLFVAKTHTTIPQIYLIKKLRDELVVMRQYDYGNCEYLMSLKDFKAYNYFVIERYKED